MLGIGRCTVGGGGQFLGILFWQRVLLLSASVACVVYPCECTCALAPCV